MCLIVLAWQSHPEYRLVVAANRDEFVARPASPAHWWADDPSILAGRDLEAGGTWMGLSRDGRFAALTNYRDPTHHRPGAPSRGALVRNCLTSSLTAAATLEDLATVSSDYAGFNMLVSDGRALGIHASTTGTVTMLSPGVYGLSNHLLDTDWPKVRLARARFTAALTRLPDDGDMLALLRDDRPAPDAHLPQTGVSAEWERLLSSAFIRAPGYGYATRCSTVVTIGHDGETRLSEWTWDADGKLVSKVIHAFREA
jgi:uncharacterized protein with NRDE domain